MKTLKHIASLAIAALLLGGCMTKELKEDELPPMRSRIVLYCCIVPDAPVFVEVDVATPYLYNDSRYDELISDYMKTAVVSLSDVNTGQSVQLVYAKNIIDVREFKDTAMVGFHTSYKYDNLFIIPKNQQFDIIPGHEYRITAEYEDCQPVSATTVVPDGAFEIRNFGIYQTGGGKDDCSYYHTHFEVHNQTTDIANFLVYSELQEYQEYYGSYFDTTIGAWKNYSRFQELWSASDPIYIQVQPNGLGMAIMDHSVCLSYHLDTLISATVWQVNVDFMRYQSAINSNTSDDFMIFPQSDIVYTNIDGGIGIFCAYVSKELVLPNPLVVK